MLSKDTYKEALADRLLVESSSDLSIAADSRSLGIQAEEMLLLESTTLAESGTTHIIESVFRTDYITPYLETITDKARLIVVVLQCNRDVLLERFANRSRHAIHNDREYLHTLRSAQEITLKSFKPFTFSTKSFNTTKLTDTVLEDYASDLQSRFFCD